MSRVFVSIVDFHRAYLTLIEIAIGIEIAGSHPSDSGSISTDLELFCPAVYLQFCLFECCLEDLSSIYTAYYVNNHVSHVDIP